MLPRIEVARVLENVQDLTNAEAEAVLEIAYLSTVVDGRLTDGELDAFATIAARLRNEPIAGAKLDKLLDGYASHIEHMDVDERLDEIGRSLTRDPARRAAYKVAFAMALADLGTNEEEERFDDTLLQILGFSSDEADALESEVYAALDDVQ